MEDPPLDTILELLFMLLILPLHRHIIPAVIVSVWRSRVERISTDHGECTRNENVSPDLSLGSHECGSDESTHAPRRLCNMTVSLKPSQHMVGICQCEGDRNAEISFGSPNWLCQIISSDWDNQKIQSFYSPLEIVSNYMNHAAADNNSLIMKLLAGLEI